MYRIHFDAKTGKFVVQIMFLGALWRNAKGMTFGTFTEAEAAVEQVGLSKLYRNGSENRRNEYMRQTPQVVTAHQPHTIFVQQPALMAQQV